MRNEPELGATSATGHVAAHVAEDVVMTRRQELRVNLGLAGPQGLVAREINLHGDVLAVPDATPDFTTEAAAAAAVAQTCG